MKNPFQKFIVVLGIACLVLGSTISTFLFKRTVDPELEKFMLAYNYIINEWYFGIDEDNLNEDIINNAIKSMIDNDIDPHSHYQITSGSIDESYSRGYGMNISYYDYYIKIVNVVANSPLSKIQLDNNQIVEPGDLIIEVNGTSTYKLGIDKTMELFKSNHIKGEVDIFKIKKQDGQIYQFQIVAGSYEVETAYGRKLDDNNGLLVISSFEMNSADKTGDILKDFSNKGIKNLLIDVRNNPGGFIDAVIEILSYFIPKGEVLVTFTSKDQSKEVRKALGGAKYYFDNILVITNSSSASASELLAGALLDHNVAKTIGSKTYGKGSAQKTIRLGIDGGQLSYTYALWTTSLERVIHGVGIEPTYYYNPLKLSDFTFYNYEKDYFLGDNNIQIEKINLMLNYLGYQVDLTSQLNQKNLEAYKEFRKDFQLEECDCYDYSMFMKLNDLRIDDYYLKQQEILDYSYQVLKGE